MGSVASRWFSNNSLSEKNDIWCSVTAPEYPGVTYYVHNYKLSDSPLAKMATGLASALVNSATKTDVYKSK